MEPLRADDKPDIHDDPGERLRPGTERGFFDVTTNSPTVQSRSLDPPPSSERISHR
jgi:hypothetical protein